MKYARWLALAGGVVAVVGIALWWWFSSGEPLDLTGRADVTITLTKGGFEPSNIYISRGTKVTFVSERENQFWPASDLHPFHEIYKAFDPRRPLEPGETWSFTFDKDGHWSYHDHIDPITTGVIIVVPPGERGDKKYDVLAACDQDDIEGRRACWKYRIQFALDEGGLDAAFEEVESVYGHGGFAGHCHLFAHDLGLLAYQKYGTKVPMTDRMTTCGQGFYHGYMEGVLSKNGGDIAEARRLCEKFDEHLGEAFPLADRQCYHGIGHGQMEYILSTRPDLIGDLPGIIGKGLADCAALPDDDARFRCASGVYAVTKDWINIQKMWSAYPAYFSLDDLFALCRLTHEEWERRACAWEFSKQAVVLANRDSDVVFSAIITGGTKWISEYIPSMVVSAAFLIGEFGVERSDEELAAACRSLKSTEYYTSCVVGIENGLLFNGKPGGEEIERSARFCAFPEFSEGVRHACEEKLVQYMSGAYGDAGLASACNALAAAGTSVSVCEM